MKTSDKFKYATDALKANRLRQAEALFRSILKHDASHSVAAFNLGIVCWRLGKLKSALRLHESLSEIFPANFDNLVALANLYAQTNQHERAISAYVQAMKLRPKDERVYYNLGISYEEFGDKSKALRFFERALKSNPTYFEAGVRKARLLEEMKRGPLAIRTFEKLLARALPSKQRLKLQYERACLLARLGRYIDALQAFALLKRKRLVEDMSSVVSDNIRDLEKRVPSGIKPKRKI